MATDTQTPTETVVFVSKYPEQRLVRVQRDDIFDSRGDRKIGQRNRDTVVAEQERENRDLLKAGVDNDQLIDIDRTDWDVEFGQDHRFETSDPKLIAWLRAHPGYNSIDGPAAFFEEGASPEEPEPRLADQMMAVARADTLEQLEAVRELEQQTHKRKAVFDTISAAEQRIQGSEVEPVPTPPETDQSTSPPTEPA